MKKVLSLLLVCAMIFSLALVGSAAGEGYTLVAGKVAQVENEDTGDMDTVFTADSYNEVACGSIDDSTQVISLKITTNTAASGGYIAIDYDESKVMPVRYNSSFSKVFNTFSDTNYYNFATAGTGVTTTQSTAATYPDTTNVIYTWTGAMSAGDVIAYLHFACIDGVTTDDFNAETFVISEDADFAATYKLYNGGASLDYQGTTYKANEGTLTTSVTYPNSDVEVGGGDDPVDKWEAADTVDGWLYDTEGKTGIVVFGKNATAKDLTAGEYGVTFGQNTYPGGAAAAVNYWAIVITDTTTEGKIITVGNKYTGEAFVGSEKWAVEVTPVANTLTTATKVAE